MLLTNAPSQGASNSNSSNQNSQNVTIANNLDSNLAKMNKELQFLQTAINEAGLTDLYHSSNAASNAAAATSNGHHHQQQQQQQQQITTLMASTAGDMTNIETILAMQCELLEHQKELKQIEYEQIEQLRQLHSNLNRLAKKFDSFETIVTSVNNGSLKLNKSNLNKLNNSIQHIKILDSELSKDLFGTSVTTGGGIGGTSNLNISGNGGTTWSLCSPQQLAGIIQTTNTNTATATPILQNLTLLNSAATAQPIELTGNGGNYIITSQLVNPGGQKQMNDICFLDPSGTVSNGGQTLKLVGQVDLSSNSASNKPTTLTLLDAAQPQFSELKTVGLLQGADTFLKLNSHTNLNGTANNTTTTTTNNTGLNNENSSTSISEKNKTQGIQTQMALNRFLREAVKQRMGVEFLINNAVSDIPSNVMRQIKKEAFEKYLPNDRRPIKAWGLAMASLRCLKRDLVKNRNKQLANQGGRQQQQPPTNFSNMLTSNAFGLSQVEVVTTTTGGNGGGAENVNSSLDHHITATSSPLAPSKPAGRRGGATIRELELNARRF